jgi:hypothetical protein
MGAVSGRPVKEEKLGAHGSSGGALILGLLLQALLLAACVDLTVPPELTTTPDPGGNVDAAETPPSRDAAAAPQPDASAILPSPDLGPPPDAGAEPPRMDATGAETPRSDGPPAGPSPDAAGAPPPDAPRDTATLPPDTAPRPPDTAPPPPDLAPDTAPDVAPDSPTIDLTRGLVGYWKLDEASGTTARDSSTTAANGTLMRFFPADWVTGFVMGGLRFDSARYTVIVVSNVPALNPTAGLTTGAWINAADWTTNRRILQKGLMDNQYRLLAEEGLLKFEVTGATTGGGGLVAAVLPTAGAWHHVAGTYDLATIRLYIDGQQVAQSVASGGINISTNNLYIGHKSTTAIAGDGWSGLLDEVVLYDRALSAEEVRRLAMGTPPR